MWKILVIDSCLPEQPRATNDHQEYLWAALITKGIAKAIGGYDRLQSLGYMDLISMLTGCAYIQVQLQCESNFYVAVQETLNKGLAILGRQSNNSLCQITNAYEYSHHSRCTRVFQIQDYPQGKRPRLRHTNQSIEKMLYIHENSERPMDMTDRCYWLDYRELTTHV